MVSKNSFINYEAVRVMIVMESIVINIGGTKEMVWRIDRLNCFMKLVCKTMLLMGYYWKVSCHEKSSSLVCQDFEFFQKFIFE